METKKPDLKTHLSTLWGAERMPFSANAKTAYLTANTQNVLERVEQMTSVHASGVIYGPNGVGKSYLMNCLLNRLDEKRYLPVVLSHSTLAGSGLLRMLSHLLGKTPRFRREDNIANLAAAFAQLQPQWPVIILEEAQNLSADAIEEFRLLSIYNHQKTQAPFSFILVGDEALMPKLMLKVNAPVITRLGYSFQLSALSYDECKGYIQSRLQEVGIFSEPFQPQVIDMLIEASAGIPRTINQLAQRSFEAALMANEQRINTQHFEQALACMPWITCNPKA